VENTQQLTFKNSILETKLMKVDDGKQVEKAELKEGENPLKDMTKGSN